MAATLRFKLIFFVPTANLNACKAAIFAAGAGRYPGPGSYSECSWQTLGMGQFKPGYTANPHLGTVGKVEQIEEYRVETLVVGQETIKKAVEALKIAHPYEEVAYEVYKLEDY